MRFGLVAAQLLAPLAGAAVAYSLAHAFTPASRTTRELSRAVDASAGRSADVNQRHAPTVSAPRVPRGEAAEVAGAVTDNATLPAGLSHSVRGGVGGAMSIAGNLAQEELNLRLEAECPTIADNLERVKVRLRVEALGPTHVVRVSELVRLESTEDTELDACVDRALTGVVESASVRPSEDLPEADFDLILYLARLGPS